VLETEEETLKRLGLDPSLKQELKRNYLNRER